MGCFIAKKPPYTLVKNATTRMWSKLGLEDMLAIDKGYSSSNSLTRTLSKVFFKGAYGIL